MTHARLAVLASLLLASAALGPLACGSDTPSSATSGAGGGASSTSLADAGARDAAADAEPVPAWAACGTADRECYATLGGCLADPCSPYGIADLVGASDPAGLANATCDGGLHSLDCGPSAYPYDPPDSAFAACEGGRCAVHDARADGLSDCEVDADCVLASKLCCPPLYTWIWPSMLAPVAAAKLAAYREAVCHEHPACEAEKQEPWVTPDVKPVCDATKHCALTGRACPAVAPTAGTACETEHEGCRYGDDPRVGCRAWFTCEISEDTHALTWQSFDHACEPIGAPGAAGCPASADAAGTACAKQNAYCALADGVLCGCDVCGSYPCTKTPTWACTDPTPPGCSAVPPNDGAPCDGRVRCEYDHATCLFDIFKVCECRLGVWRCEAMPCPP